MYIFMFIHIIYIYRGFSHTYLRFDVSSLLPDTRGIIGVQHRELQLLGGHASLDTRHGECARQNCD